MKRLAILLALSTPGAGCMHSPPAPKVVPIVRSLSWEGKATVHAGERNVDIRVRTHIAANGDVVSESWPAEQGEQALRRMIIDTTGGWMARGDKRESMPKERLQHERQQFGFYTQLQTAIASGEILYPPDLEVPGPTWTTFKFDQHGRPVEARNRVVSPEPRGQPIDQIFLLSGEIASNGLRWPREIRILQHGKPYFTLTIEKFEAGAAP